jgi:hypothetical protein
VDDEPIMAVVLVTDKNKGDTEYLVTYSYKSVKAWLVKTTVWCLLNNETLTIRRATEHDLKTRRKFKPDFVGVAA